MAVEAIRPGLSASGAATGRQGRAGGGASRARIPVIRLLQISLLLLAVGQLGRFPVATAGSKEAPLLLNDLFVLGLVFLGMAVALRKRELRLDRVSLLALLFAGIGGLSALLAVPRIGLTPFEALFSLAYLGRWVTYFALYLVVLNTVRRDQVEGVWKALEAGVLVFAAFGILQSIFLPNFAQIVYPDAELYTQWDPQGRRLVSTMLDPNFAGALILLVLAVQGGRMAFGVPVALWKPVLLLLAVTLTVSRSTLLAGLAAGAVIAAVRGTSRRVVRFGIGGVLVGLLALPYVGWLAVTYNKLDLTDPSLLSRFVAWSQALEVFADFPVIGVGFNTYGFAQDHLYGFSELQQAAFGLDGGLLFIAVMTGSLGVLVYATMILVQLLRCRRGWMKGSDARTRGLMLGTAAATVGLLVHSLFTNSMLYPFLMEVLWVLWGLTAVSWASGLDEGAFPSPGREAVTKSSPRSSW